METLNSIVSDLAFQYPTLVTIFTVIGVLRTIMKPIMTMIHGYAVANPSKGKYITDFEAGPVYKSLVWLLDWSASVKLPGAPK